MQGFRNITTIHDALDPDRLHTFHDREGRRECSSPLPPTLSHHSFGTFVILWTRNGLLFPSIFPLSLLLLCRLWEYLHTFLLINVLIVSEASMAHTPNSGHFFLCEYTHSVFCMTLSGQQSSTVFIKWSHIVSVCISLARLLLGIVFALDHIQTRCSTKFSSV